MLPSHTPSSSSMDTQPETKPTPSNLHSKPSFFLLQPLAWLRMLCGELTPSFVFGVFLVYGLSQGFTGSFFRVVTDYYWKDVQKIQPSDVQMLSGLYYIPWVMKPVWGILTDVFPVFGYRRRPYFVFSGVVGTIACFLVSSVSNLSVPSAVLCFIGLSVSVAIADVTIDACIATNGILKPNLASDMQSLCGYLSGFGALVGYSCSGFLVHNLGPQAALSLMALPSLLLILLGFVLFELKNHHHSSDKEKAFGKVKVAVKGMGKTMKHSSVWKPTLYMFISLALSISTHEGQFYWYTDKTAGPTFSQEFVGMIYAIGATSSMLGVLIYHKFLTNISFRSLLFHSQFLFSLSGFLDLFFVLRWNLRFNLPDSIFVIIEESCTRIAGRIRWMPMIVLSTKLCPSGIEGTFFSLLMCVDSLGFLGHKIGGGLVLRALGVTREEFGNLWVALLVRNLLRFCVLGFVFLVPDRSPSDVLVPHDLVNLMENGGDGSLEERVELVKVGGGEDDV